MTAVFGSCREAIAYYFAARRGPRAARPRWTDTAPETRRRDETHWVQVGALLHGPRPDGCAVEIDSAVESQLRRWATGQEAADYTPAVRRVEDQLRPLLRAHGLLRRQTRYKSERVEGTYAAPEDRAGTPTSTTALHEIDGEDSEA